jgi:hypothetical protein
MPRGEPPGRRRTGKKRPSASTYKPSRFKTQSSSMPTFGPGGGGAASARLQDDLNKITPAKDKAEVWGRALESLFYTLSDAETMDAVRSGRMNPLLGGGLVAAGALPVGNIGKQVGKGVAKGAQSLAKREAQEAAKAQAARANASLTNLTNELGAPVKSADAIARQRARGSKAMDAGGAARFYSPEEMQAAAQALARANDRPEKVVTIRQPKPENIRTDGPEMGATIPAGSPVVRPAYSPNRPKGTASYNPDGSINIDKLTRDALNNTNKGKKQKLTENDVLVTYNGVGQPQKDEFFRQGPDGKLVEWPQGYKSALNKFKTRETAIENRSSELLNAVDVANMTPQQYAAFRVSEGLKASPDLIESRANRLVAQDAAEGETKNLMRPPDGSPPDAASPVDQGMRVNRPARGQRPKRDDYETKAEFDEAIANYEATRKNTNLKKKKSSLKRPKKRKGESDSAYQKRLDDWNAKTRDPNRTPQEGDPVAVGVAQRERARVDEKLRDSQPSRVESADVIPAFPENQAAGEYIPSGASKLPEPTFSRKPKKAETPKKTEEPTPAESAKTPFKENVEKPTAKKSTKKSAAKKTTKKSTTKKSTTKKSTKKSAAKKTTPKQETPQPDEIEIPKRGSTAPTAPKTPKTRTPKKSTKKSTKKQTVKKPSAKKTTKKQTAKKTTKKTTKKQAAKKTPPQKPQSMIDKQRERDLAKIDGATKSTKAKTEKAKTEKPKKSKKRKFGSAVAAGLGGGTGVATAGIVGAKLINVASEKQGTQIAEKAVTSVESSGSPTSVPENAPEAVKQILRDKYGRKITREEFERRKKYREAMKNMPADRRAAKRKQEMERRKKWRESTGKQLFKQAATTKTRNTRGKTRMDSDAVKALKNVKVTVSNDSGGITDVTPPTTFSKNGVEGRKQSMPRPSKNRLQELLASISATGPSQRGPKIVNSPSDFAKGTRLRLIEQKDGKFRWSKIVSN